MKRALQWGALFIWGRVLRGGSVLLCLGFSSSAMASDCRAERIDEEVHVAYVYDGDTVRLDDGRKLRLAGINTPEVAHGQSPGEPLADEARLFLSSMLEGDRRVRVRYEVQRHDRYGRLLAHLYLMDDSSIEERLLAEGLALQLVVPPNSWQSDCYRQVERDARRRQRGVWRHDYYRPLSGPPVAGRVDGFQLRRGVVRRVTRSNESVWLTLDSGVVLRVPRADLPRFDGVALETLTGQQVEARGWLHYANGQYQLTVRDPVALTVESEW